MMLLSEWEKSKYTYTIMQHEKKHVFKNLGGGGE